MSSSTRRAGGALGCLLIMHLGLLAGDLGCARHEAGVPRETTAPPANEGATQHAHHQHGASATEPTDQPPSDSCRTPSRADCCEAMASCQVQIAFAEPAEPMATPASDAILRGPELVPASGALTPDVPPPKA